MKTLTAILFLLPFLALSQSDIEDAKLDSVRRHFEGLLDKNYISEYYNSELLWEYLMVFPNNEYFFNHTIVPVLLERFIDDKGRADRMFPFCTPDSAVHYVCKKSDDLITYAIDPNYYELTGKVQLNPEVEFTRFGKLPKQRIYQLISFLTMPSNFDFGQCGTCFPENITLFYSDGEAKAALTTCCNYGQILSYPENPRSKFGAIDSELHDMFKDFFKKK